MSNRKKDVVAVYISRRFSEYWHLHQQQHRYEELISSKNQHKIHAVQMGHAPGSHTSVLWLTNTSVVSATLFCRPCSVAHSLYFTILHSVYFSGIPMSQRDPD